MSSEQIFEILLVEDILERHVEFELVRISVLRYPEAQRG